MGSRSVFSIAASLICIIFLYASFGLGQANERSIHIGFKAGVSIPNLIGSGDQEITRDYKSRVAPSFGGFVDYGVTRHFSLFAGLDYSGQGGKRNGVQPITRSLPGLPPLPTGQYYFGDFKNTAKLQYIELPLMAKYNGGKTKKIGFYLNAGPYVGYLLKATTVTAGSSTIFLDKNKTPLLLPPFNQPLPPIPWDATTDVISSLHRWNFGLTGGGGITFPSADNYFFVDARGSYGFTTLQRNTATDGSSRTGNLVISLGYAFKIKGK